MNEKKERLYKRINQSQKSEKERRINHQKKLKKKQVYHRNKEERLTERKQKTLKFNDLSIHYDQ